MYQERRARSTALAQVTAAQHGAGGRERVAQGGPGDGRERGDAAGEAGTRHELPALDPAPIVAHEVNRPLGRDRSADGVEVVGQPVQVVGGTSPRRTGVTGAAHVVGDHVKAGGQALHHRRPHRLGVGIAVHEHERRAVRVAGALHAQLHLAGAHGPGVRCGRHPVAIYRLDRRWMPKNFRGAGTSGPPPDGAGASAAEPVSVARWRSSRSPSPWPLPRPAAAAAPRAPRPPQRLTARPLARMRRRGRGTPPGATRAASRPPRSWARPPGCAARRRCRSSCTT